MLHCLKIPNMNRVRSTMMSPDWSLLTGVTYSPTLLTKTLINLYQHS